MSSNQVLGVCQKNLSVTGPWFEPQAVYVNVPYLSRIRALFSSQGDRSPEILPNDMSQVGNYLTIKFQLLDNPEAPAPFNPDVSQKKLMAQQVDHIYNLWDEFHRGLQPGLLSINGLEILKFSEFELFPTFGECIIDVDCDELLKPLHFSCDDESVKVLSA